MKKYSHLQHAPLFRARRSATMRRGNAGDGTDHAADIVAKKVGTAADVHKVLADYYAGETFRCRWRPAWPTAGGWSATAFLRADRLDRHQTRWSSAVYGKRGRAAADPGGGLARQSRQGRLGRGGFQVINLKTGVRRDDGTRRGLRRLRPIEAAGRPVLEDRAFCLLEKILPPRRPAATRAFLRSGPKLRQFAVIC